MLWLIRVCFITGIALLALPDSRVVGQAIPNAICAQSWACMGTPAGTTCMLTAGRVPNCVSFTGSTCSYFVPGYICTGTDAGGGPCSQNYSGCQ